MTSWGEYLVMFVLIFLDDILLYSRAMKEHGKHLKKVLKKLKDCRDCTKTSKCIFVVSSDEFLGQRISGGVIAPIKRKLRAVCNQSRPQNVHKVRSFLDFANYCRKFVYNFSHLAKSLTGLIKKDILWYWGPY